MAMPLFALEPPELMFSASIRQCVDDGIRCFYNDTCIILFRRYVDIITQCLIVLWGSAFLLFSGALC